MVTAKEIEMLKMIEAKETEKGGEVQLTLSGLGESQWPVLESIVRKKLIWRHPQKTNEVYVQLLESGFWALRANERDANKR